MELTDSRHIFEEGLLIDERFEIQRYLGAGGFATVYAAKQLQVDRNVALKFLENTQPGPARDEFEKRFVREAKLAAQINHPNVVTIFDFGVGGPYRQPYIAMELLEGKDLSDILKAEGAMEPKRAIKLFRGALDALAEGHGLGIIHKDLKPSNLFVKKPNSPRESLAVLDFGVARLAEVAEGASLTNTGQLMGTPKYLPPEYIRDQKATFALDVYQMGLILVEMLRGNAVVESTSPLDCLLVHAQGKIDVPKSLLTGPLGPVLKKSLAYDYQERYQTAEAFLEALESVDITNVVVGTELVPVSLDLAEPIGDDHQETAILAEEIVTDVREGSGVLHYEELDEVRRKSRLPLLLFLIAFVFILATVFVLMQDTEEGEKQEAKGTPAVEDPKPGPADESDVASAPPELTLDTHAGEDLGSAGAGSPDAVDAEEETKQGFEVEEKFRVEVSSSPIGSQVYLQGDLIGETPTALKFPAGQKDPIVLTFKKKGYKEARVEIVPTQGEAVMAQLERIKRKDPKPKDPEPKDPEPKDPKPDKEPDGPTLLIAD